MTNLLIQLIFLEMIAIYSSSWYYFVSKIFMESLSSFKIELKKKKEVNLVQLDSKFWFNNG